MLNGIGGNTIEQARHALSYEEFLSWVKYRNQFGSLNPSHHVERGFALLASMFASAHSKDGGYSFYDFAPHFEEPEIKLEDAVEQWK